MEVYLDASVGCDWDRPSLGGFPGRFWKVSRVID